MVRVGGGSPGPPDLVSDDVSEGLGFFDRAIGEEASPDGLDASEVGGLVVPEAHVGRMRGDVLLHVPGQAAPYPKEAPCSVDGVGHVHLDAASMGVIVVTA